MLMEMLKVSSLISKLKSPGVNGAGSRKQREVLLDFSGENGFLMGASLPSSVRNLIIMHPSSGLVCSLPSRCILFSGELSTLFGAVVSLRSVRCFWFTYSVLKHV